MEEDEICRVCRSEGSPEQPLFHPCRCSGSIRYVHQDCLLEWLEHSNKRYCELCKYSFSFTPIYSPEMPETIPKRVLIGRAIDKLSKGVCLFLRAVLVALIWLAMLPYFTIWVWRLYFWIGETFAFRANGLETPLWNSTTFFASRHNLTSVSSTSAMGTDKALEGISLLLFQSVAPEYQWISKFILDCFEGQIISSVVVVVFVAIFLLREWVLQNQEGDDLRMAANEAVAPVLGGADAQGFNMEHAVERFIAAQHHIEAVVEGEADLSDDDDDLDSAEQDQTQATVPNPVLAQARPEPWNLMNFHNHSEAREERNAASRGQSPGFFLENDNAGEGGSSSASASSLNPSISPFGSWPSEHGLAADSATGRLFAIDQEARPSNERTFSSDPTTGIYASTNTLDKGGRRPSALDEGLNQGYSFRTPEDMPSVGNKSPSSPKVGYVYDSLNQTYYPDTRWPSTSASDSAANTDFQLAGGANWLWSGQEPTATFNGEGPSNNSQSLQGRYMDPIRSKNGATLYWQNGIPLTYENVYLNADGSEMSFSEKVARYEDLCKTGDLTFADVRRLPTLWRPTQVTREQIPTEGLPEAMDIRARQRQEMVRQINERGIRMRMRDGAPPQRDNEEVENVLQPMPVRAAVPPPPPAAAEVEDELEDVAVEDLDGILEVIGMHGSYWLLLQNSLLMSALICASLGLGVWIPFMIGKTTLLMSPVNVLRIPLTLLSRLTDPVLDFILDQVFPFLAAICSKTMTAVSSTLSPYVTPLFGDYLGTSALQSLTVLYQGRILPLWEAFIELTVSSVAQGAYPKETSASLAETMLQRDMGANNSTIVHRVAKKWADVAYGTTSSDKFAAVFVGYAIMFMIASWYFAHTQHSYRSKFVKMARDVLRQQGLILKIAVFVAIDMILFPLFCGVVISLSTLPVFKGATMATRIAFYLYSPNWSLIMHWLVGTAFMFNFSVFVGICRAMVRPGVMWFIRDPNDQGFHPVREILERPAMLQLRKLGSGALMYCTLIVLGLGLTTHAVHLLMRGALPLRWPVNEPISDFPVDLLLYHLVVPLTARWLNPTDRAKILFAGWWCKLAHWLRLSSFMYGMDGRRYYDEEGYIVYRTWKAWLLRSRPLIPGSDTVDEIAIGSGEELDVDAPAVFVRDGGLMRVPNSDRIVHLKDRRVIVPVDENGNALDPDEDLFGEIDPLMELQPRARDGPRPLLDPKENTTIVYTPPNFKRRLIAFIALFWTSVMAFLVLSLVLPTVMGREIFALRTDKKVHDIYSFIVGVYVVRLGWFIMDWSMSQYQKIMSHGLRPVDTSAQLKTLRRICTVITKLLYFGLTFGILMPLALGLVTELFVIMPLLSYIDVENTIMFITDWATGLLYLKIVHRLVTIMPNNRFGADLNRVFVGMDVNEWDAGLATRRLILPMFGICALAVVGPFCLAWVTTACLDLDPVTRLRIFRQVYPAVLLVGLIVVGLKESVVIIQGWSQYVRDQEYLVGRQLHNLREDEEEPPALSPVPAPVPALELTEAITDIGPATDAIRAGAPLQRSRRFVESDDEHKADEQDDWFTTRLDSFDPKEMDGSSISSSTTTAMTLTDGKRTLPSNRHREEMDSEEEGTIAQRTRSRTSQRLLAREEKGRRIE